ncbi:transposase [Rhodopirellula sp. MGV]|uniref:transposase n=1 Tax=Rhodopirellula sp. MGV TaxID=2023130 RepID=UPI0028F40FDA|nr:transposase [Rhodopirellula sp. MGV]
MPRPKRADKKNAIYHALNRGNARSTIFHKDADYEAFENILAEGTRRYPCRVLAYQLMPNHWHPVLQPTAGLAEASQHAAGRQGTQPDPLVDPTGQSAGR